MRQSQITYITFCALTGLISLAPVINAREYTPQTICNVDIKIQPNSNDQSAQPDQAETETPKPPQKILGEIVVMGRPVAGVLIQANNQGGSCVTDEKGQYALEVPWGWSGRVSPSKEGWVFAPPYRTYTKVTWDVNERSNPDEQSIDEWPTTDAEEDVNALNESPGVQPSWGRLAVTPMVIALEGHPGQILNTELTLQNIGIQSPQVSLALADLVQQSNGPWHPVEPDPTQTPTRSCREWLTLTSSQKMTRNLAHMGTTTCPLEIKIPHQARGFYSAALLVQPAKHEGMTSPINCTLVIPVLLEVNLAEAEMDVEISDIELVVPFSTDHTQVPRIRLTLDNRGETLCCLNASVSALPTNQVHQSPTSPAMAFKRQWIMPKTRLSLETEYVGPQPNQALILKGLLDLVQEQQWSKTIGSPNAETIEQMGVNPRPLTDDPIQTIAMLDYNEKQRIHMEPRDENSYPFDLTGHCQFGMTTNFPASIQPIITEVLSDCADWSAYVTPSHIQGPTRVRLTIEAEDLAIERLCAGQQNLVAIRTGVLLIPEIGRWR